MFLRKVARGVLDYLVDMPHAMYLIAAALAALTVRTPKGYTWAFVEASLPTMSSTAFALFGFVATALSILTSLKTTPFFAILQEVPQGSTRSMWHNLVGAFLHLMGIFACLGVFSFSITKERINGLPIEYYNIVVFLYAALVAMAFIATIVAIYLLRLVANAPLPSPQITDRVEVAPTEVTASQGIVDV